MTPTTEELAARKLDKAAKLLGEYCSLTGRKAILLRVDHTPAGPGAEIVTKPSHEPTRHPETPLPLPSPGQTCPETGLRHDAPSLEMERRITAAKKWSAATNHESAIHRAERVESNVIHHPECAYETSCKLERCDCGPTFLVRVSGRIFAVDADGSLARFTPPTPSPAEFRSNPAGFFWNQSFGGNDVSVWLSPLLSDDGLSFATVGDGETERFIEPPHKVPQ